MQNKQSYWIQGWGDQVANLKVTLNCLQLIDVQGNGLYNIVVADQSQRIISYKNTNIAWETRLQDKPTCMISVNNDGSQPCICIGCGENIFLYKVFKAFVKFELPPIPMKPNEMGYWKQYQNDKDTQQLISSLVKVQKSGIPLSYKSLELICYQDIQKQQEIAEKYQDNLYVEDSVTCMDCLKKTDDIKCTAQLIVGTELKCIHIMNSDLMSIQKTFELPSTPIIIASYPEEQKDGRIAVLVRDNCIYFIGNQIEDYKIDLQSKPITMIRQLKLLYVATMDRQIVNYSHKSKQYQLKMQANIIGMESILTGKGQEIRGLIVALDNGYVYFYSGVQLICTFQSNVSVMRYGQLGQSQDNFLVIITQNGSIETRSLSREFEKKRVPLISEENLQAIEFPPVTKLFLENHQREKEQGQNLLKTYQFDLLRLRYKAASSYLNILNNNDEQLPQILQNNSLKIALDVEGLGPKFKIVGYVENLSTSPIKDVYINYIYNTEIYQSINTTNYLPYLIPKHSRYFECFFLNIHSNGLSDTIKLSFIQKGNVLVSAQIQMPMSDLE